MQTKVSYTSRGGWVRFQPNYDWDEAAERRETMRPPAVNLWAPPPPEFPYRPPLVSYRRDYICTFPHIRMNKCKCTLMCMQSRPRIL